MKTFKVGDLVRVRGSSFNTPAGLRYHGPVRHHIIPGAVCVVLTASEHGATVSGPMRYDSRPGSAERNSSVGNPITQGVQLDQLKLAKQAMKKRAAYAARRGGPFEIPSALVSADLAAAERRWAHI